MDLDLSVIGPFRVLRLTYGLYLSPHGNAISSDVSVMAVTLLA